MSNESKFGRARQSLCFPESMPPPWHIDCRSCNQATTRRSGNVCTVEVFPRTIRGRLLWKLVATLDYGEGEDVVVLVLDSVLFSPAGEDVLMVVFDSVSVLFEVAGDGFTIVVLLSFFSPAGGLTVVSFCSHATSRAAPARMQMYFFII